MYFARNLPRLASAIFAVVTTVAMPAFAQSETLVGLAVALKEVKATLQTTVTTVDAQTGNRIRQVEIAIDEVLVKLDASIDKGGAVADGLRDRLAGDAAVVLGQANEMVQSSTNNAFENLNNSLANAYRVANAIPFLSIPTTISVVRPYSVQKSVNAVPVQFQGFFPDVSAARPAHVLVNNSKVPLDIGVNNTLSFTLPGRWLPPEEDFLEMVVVVPVKRWLGLFYDEARFNAKIYVRRAKPFDVSVRINEQNPALWNTVAAPRPYTATANSEQTTNAADVTAASLFSSLVNDDVTYDMSTATVLSWARSNTDAIVASGSPCASGCVAASGTWSWAANRLTYDLRAPSCAMHIINPSGFFEVPYQCGGGTNSNFSNTPTFRVKRRNVPEEVNHSEQALALARKSTSAAVALPSGWTSIDVITVYRDGTERAEGRVRLTSAAPAKLTANEPLWKVEVLGQGLVVSTR